MVKTKKKHELINANLILPYTMFSLLLQASSVIVRLGITEDFDNSGKEKIDQPLTSLLPHFSLSATDLAGF